MRILVVGDLAEFEAASLQLPEGIGNLLSDNIVTMVDYRHGYNRCEAMNYDIGIVLMSPQFLHDKDENWCLCLATHCTQLMYFRRKGDQ